MQLQQLSQRLSRPCPPAKRGACPYNSSARLVARPGLPPLPRRRQTVTASVAGPSFESLDIDDAPALRGEPWLNKLVAPPAECEKDGYVAHPTLLNPNLLDAQYAVRGELYLRAEELKKTRTIIYTNVGNPQALGAKPLTFLRQVAALCAAPFLLDHPSATELFPADAISRARSLLAAFGTGGLGGYTDSRGVPAIREEVAAFIERRDGHRPEVEHIYLTDGASVGVRNVLQALIRGPRDAVLVPIPQYPLYSASISLFGGRLLPYQLDEVRGWGLDLDSLSRQLAAARAEGLSVRALVFINPGNPTGQNLSADAVRRLARWAKEHRVVLLADEVYQELVYNADSPFCSAHKAVMDAPPDQRCELISFHSVSKGTSGECGLRGGYTVFTGLHPDTVAQFYKLSSIGLCPNTLGQVAVSVLSNPPQPGDPSYDLWNKERSDEFASLARRAALVSAAFNSLPNMSVVPTQAAMYAFPEVIMPPAAIAAAEAAGKKPDVFYCLKLLEEAGICTIPGSGFGQAPGTQHFRTTFLPREEVMAAFVESFKAFHTKFMETYTQHHGGNKAPAAAGAARSSTTTGTSS